MPNVTRLHRAAALLCSLGISSLTLAGPPGAPADAAHREGDEIVIGGQYFHTGTTVVLWSDPGGFDLTGLTHPFRVPLPTTGLGTTAPTTTAADATTNATAASGGNADAMTRVVRGPDVPLDVLRESIDQFVVHFDDCGISAECYRVLKRRGLSVQFMCDLDGTIYQTMGAGENAPHATKANRRSVGCEVANMGTFPIDGAVPAEIREWYAPTAGGPPRITIPAKFAATPQRTKDFVGHPARAEPVAGLCQGTNERQYDYTPQQYRALAQLTATLCSTLPKIQPDYPRFRAAVAANDHFELSKKGNDELIVDATPGSPTTRPDAIASPDEKGPLIPHVLTTDQYNAFQGVVGHYHVQTNKDDPGPAFQWEALMTQVRTLMTPAAKAACAAERKRPAVTAQRSTTQPQP